jgi:hypothetical protein
MTAPKLLPILADITRACAPVPLPAPLARLPAGRQALRLASEPEELFRQLQARYSAELLIESRVAERIADGAELRLHPALAADHMFLPLWKHDNGEPFDLLIAGGCLSARRLPITAVIHEQATRRQLRDRPLLLCSDLIDAGIFRALGMPATTTAGLTTLSQRQLSVLTRIFGWKRGLLNENHDQFETTNRVRLSKLVLVGWQPHCWSAEAPSELAQLAAFLKQLRLELQIGLPEVLVWRPPCETLDSLCFVASRGSHRELRARMTRSIASDSAPLFPVAKPRPPSLAAAFRKATDPETIASAHASMKATEELERTFKSVITEPLFAQASQQASATEAQRYSMLAIVSAIIAQRTCPFLIELHRRSGAERSWSTPAAEFGDIAQLLRLSGEFRSLIGSGNVKKRRK